MSVNTVLVIAIAVAVLLVIASAGMCFIRWTDGTMTGRAELAEDIAEDTMEEPS